jgi:GNAT superfamily N-acetyltransferase
MTIVVRFATPADAGQIVQFIHGLAEYEHEAAAVQATPESIRAQMEEPDPPFECLMAELGGEPVGFALFFRTYSTWSARPGLYLEDLFVPDQYRGQGVGKALLRRLAAITVERGWARMEWAALDWNKPAQAFYTSLGALAKNEWTVWRIDGDALAKLAHES